LPIYGAYAAFICENYRLSINVLDDKITLMKPARGLYVRFDFLVVVPRKGS